MATTAKTDPTLGVPVAGAPAPKTAPAAAPNVIPFKKSRLTGAARKAALEMATKMSGYDNTSPIWGKTVLEVLDMIDNASTASEIQMLTQEFRKRIAKGQLIKAQS